MHLGAVDQTEIDRWTAADGRIQAQQTVKMITVDGSNMLLGESQTPEADSIMDISFVTQNGAFDFLLDLEIGSFSFRPAKSVFPSTTPRSEM